MINPANFEQQVDSRLSLSKSVHDADLVVAGHKKTGGKGLTRFCMCCAAGEHTCASEIQKFGCQLFDAVAVL